MKARKKKIPLCPRRIGVITSPTGAVIKDIIHRIKERFPIEIILYPVHVQGRLALNEIVESIKEFNFWKKNKNISKIVDLIIIARGGGDLEDLMPFNEEPLVKAIYASEIPIISAIGHESDVTLCDFAADLRAPTPTAAAEIAVPVRSELYKKFKEKNNYFESLVSNLIDQLKIKLSEKVGRLPNLENSIQYNFQKLDLTEVKLESSIKENLIKKKLLIKKLGQEFKIESMFQKIKIFRLNIENTFSNIKKETKKILLDKKVNIKEKKKLLDSLSYKRILARGYTVIWQKTKVITKSEEIKKQEEFKIEFYDGKIDAKKLINFFILKFIIILPNLSNSNNFNFDILGCFCEGGMIYGIVNNGEQVKINDLKIKLSSDNYFVYAFGRKHDEIIKIKIGEEEKTFKVKNKKYKIEKINNLPTRKVEPSQKDMKKILKESDELKKVKNLDINNKLFSDQFLIPVEGRISGRFGSQRILNGKAKRPHYGLDIAAKKGTKIYAPTDGKIKKVFDNMFFTGNTVIIDHGLGLISIFAHLEKIFISENQLVSKGDLVGSVGMTGRATGPHLHWGIYLKNVPVDPEIFIDLNVLE